MHHPAHLPISSHFTRTPRLLFAVIACVVMVVLWFSTAGGLNVDDDGLRYIEGGRNIAAGLGYQFAVPPLPPEPVTHFPPLYPAAIAALTLLIGDPHAAARWVNILCLGAETWLACWLVWKAGGRRLPAVLAGAALARPIHLIPVKRNVFTTAVIPEAQQEMGKIGEQAASGLSVLVYIHPNRPRQNFSLDEEHAVELGPNSGRNSPCKQP